MAPSVKVNGAEIERLRKKRAGLTRTEAAKILGMSQVALYYIERGRPGKIPSTHPKTLQRIAVLLRTTPEELSVNEDTATPALAATR